MASDNSPPRKRARLETRKKQKDRQGETPSTGLSSPLSSLLRLEHHSTVVEAPITFNKPEPQLKRFMTELKEVDTLEQEFARVEHQLKEQKWKEELSGKQHKWNQREKQSPDHQWSSRNSDGDADDESEYNLVVGMQQRTVKKMKRLYHEDKDVVMSGTNTEIPVDENTDGGIS